MAERSYRYVVIEDEALIRRNLIKKIEEQGLPLSFAGEAANGMDGILLISTAAPHIVITDIRMPVSDGLEVARYVHTNLPQSKTVIVSGYSDFQFAREALRYAVSDYLLKPLRSQALRETLEHILIGFNVHNQEQSPAPRSLTRSQLCRLMEDYLKAHYRTTVCLGEMAAFIGFSLEYLGKIFKAEHGKSLSKYLASLRIAEAKQLLTSRPDLDIGQVGSLAGYKDNFYFSRIFKAHTGLSPSEYRLLHTGSV